jgi:hypothetical protein
MRCNRRSATCSPRRTTSRASRVEGEAAGYGYATISDHVVIPRALEARYPCSDTGEFPGRSRGDRHEQLTAVAFVAGKTSRLRLVTSRIGRRYKNRPRQSGPVAKATRYSSVTAFRPGKGGTAGVERLRRPPRNAARDPSGMAVGQVAPGARR